MTVFIEKESKFPKVTLTMKHLCDVKIIHLCILIVFYEHRKSFTIL
jgi:hypothetical protein